MALTETRAVTSPRTVMQAEGVCDITLAGTVLPGDCLGITGGTWVLSADASGEQPLLVAIEGGVSGDVIKCAMMAVLTITTTSTNKATLGEIVSIDDSGLYGGSTSAEPDVGFVVSVDSGDLGATIVVCPLCPQLTTVRA